MSKSISVVLPLILCFGALYYAAKKPKTVTETAFLCVFWGTLGFCMAALVALLLVSAALDVSNLWG